nr:hypothetical protein Iba_chr14cCG14300 [Ipomoea batatas]
MGGSLSGQVSSLCMENFKRTRVRFIQVTIFAPVILDEANNNSIHGPSWNGRSISKKLSLHNIRNSTMDLTVSNVTLPVTSSTNFRFAWQLPMWTRHYSPSIALQIDGRCQDSVRSLDQSFHSAIAEGNHNVPNFSLMFRIGHTREHLIVKVNMHRLIKINSNSSAYKPVTASETLLNAFENSSDRATFSTVASNYWEFHWNQTAKNSFKSLDTTVTASADSHTISPTDTLKPPTPS